MFLALCIIIGIYGIGGYLYNRRAFGIFMREIAWPWRNAIATHDYMAAEHWRTVGGNFRLQNPDHIFNPAKWIQCWNWKPPRPPIRLRKWDGGNYLN